MSNVSITPANCSIIRCNSYDYDLVYNSLAESIKNLGGFEPYIVPGERVLLKANLLMKKKPEEATTTHPIFVKALANLLIEYGAKVVIGDSPGGPFNANLMNGVYKATGMAAIAEETEAILNNNYNSFQKENPKGLIMKKLTLTDMINDADKVISVAKLKTHAMMTYTGAVKNMFGVVPGIVKAEYHLNIPNYEQFSDMLIDICLCAEPVLSFIDGIVGMEGHGPSAGTPVNINAVMASNSPYHIDQAACHIIGLAVKDVPMLKRMQEREIISELSDINFTGESIEKFIMPSFEIISGKSSMTVHDSNLPVFVKNFIGKHMQTRPQVNNADCTGCAICQEACPAKIVEMSADHKAIIDYPKCIRCYCCQELCPQKAIKMYKPRMVKMLKL
ncbi:MAG: DUF362 domain-containing protein [Defluviitaleaceae bacterium]|nr:DUF362 domain-containing protein [Defluviitaleaceae bacterium]